MTLASSTCKGHESVGCEGLVHMPQSLALFTPPVTSLETMLVNLAICLEF